MKQSTMERNGCSLFSLSLYSLCVSISLSLFTLSFFFHPSILSFQTYNDESSTTHRIHIHCYVCKSIFLSFFSHFSFIPLSLSFYSSHLPLFSFLSFQQMLPKGYTHLDLRTKLHIELFSFPRKFSSSVSSTIPISIH